MKSILMSIQPKWCEVIVHDSYVREDAYGAVKKLEVRKTNRTDCKKAEISKIKQQAEARLKEKKNEN